MCAGERVESVLILRLKENSFMLIIPTETEVNGGLTLDTCWTFAQKGLKLAATLTRIVLYFFYFVLITS